MQLLYSGADFIGAPQSSILKSLGGFISGTNIPNGRVNSLFSNASIEIGVDHIAIFIKNQLTVPTSFRFGYETNVNGNIQAAFVLPTENQIERIISPSDSPLFAEFESNQMRKSKSILLISQAPTIGEIITIDSITFTSNSSTIQGLIDQIVQEFIVHTNYNVSKISDIEVIFEYKIYGSNIFTITLISSGTAQGSQTNFINGLNRAINLPSLAVGDCFGLWFKRTLNSEKQTFQQQYDSFLEKQAIERKQKTGIPLTFEENNIIEGTIEDQFLKLIIEW